MENSESRNAPSPEAESDDSASPIPPDPAEDRAYWRGVVDGIARAGAAVPPDLAARAEASPATPPDPLGFDPVPLRRREDGLTPERQRDYVEALADTGIAREAAARIGLTEQSINRVRRRADARSFDLACEAAHRFGARRLRSVAWERAIEGTVKGHYYHGELVSQERVYDNRLLVYLLGRTEHLLDPPEESRAVCLSWEPYMDALEQGLPPPGLAPPAVDPDEGEEEWASDSPDFGGYDIDVWEDEGLWWTAFPPPDGFDGEERGEFGDDDYQRTLTAEEQAVVDADDEEERAEFRAREATRRDAFFGFARGEIICPGEAEPHEPSADGGPDERPIEFKSADPVILCSARKAPGSAWRSVRGRIGRVYRPPARRTRARPAGSAPDNGNGDGNKGDRYRCLSPGSRRRGTVPGLPPAPRIP